EVVITDPITLQQSFAYVMLSAKNTDGTYRVTPRFTAANSPYVFYQRDPNADQFVYSQSAFSNYGNAPKGPVCNADGTPSIGHGFKYDTLGNIVLDVTTFVQRRPLDTATVNTPRYSFRYDGRWVMDSITVSPDDKGLSTGDYVQRDMAAGRITTYRNNYTPDGVQVDGLNDEAFGNLRAHVGPDGAYVTDSPGSVIYNDANGNPIVVGSPNDQHCPSPCIHGNFDLPDLKFSGPPGTLQWEELSGPVGTTVERWNVQQVTPVGTPLAAVATMPYFRDDSCFDDGTGMDPGPKLHLRSATEPSTWGYDPVTGIPVSPAPAGATQVFQRRCWNHHPDGTPYNIPGATFFDPTNAAELPDPIPDPGFSPQGDIRYSQGD